ncbi:MAG TPA: Nif3-like dinuclear metal center hexameric protein [Chthonomonadaceae bacterium]|nr:Nif3-like dinuclear metal center hexameric protein [Chthonomonadaceae bacterium]
MQLAALVEYLNDYLRIDAIPDYSGALNGLQVAGAEAVRRIAVAVDACQATIDQAAADGADVLVVHHGLFWGRTAPVTGMYYRRLSALIRHNVALYSCHLPLDAHPEVGNNHVLARMLSLTPDGSFGAIHGVEIGVTASAGLSRAEFVVRVQEALGVTALVIGAGPEAVRRVGVLTGGGGSLIAEAASAGIDTFVTGEGQHHTYFEAEERGLNVIYAGHYATETVGIRALGDHLRERFGLQVDFIDHPTGL